MDSTPLTSSTPAPFPNSCDESWNWRLECTSREVKLCDRTVLFHPNWSNGTAAIRGSKVLNGGQHYWEVRVSHRVFGTSLMFGVGTREAQLYRGSFVNLLGADAESWGLSHKGLVWHDGQSNLLTESFQENQSTTIGLLFDGLKGTLRYFKDGKDLGVAFEGLNSVDKPIYPMIASTAARTEMSLQNTLRPAESLQDICLASIVRQLRCSEDVTQLPLPRQLQSELLKIRQWPSEKPVEFKSLFAKQNVNISRKPRCLRNVAKLETLV